ncbi:MAG: hypothetical protein WC319_11160 [Candidatus Paceibacterota bacterium]|jgi:hypothetical protein
MEHFRNKMVRGKAIGAQRNFAHNFNRVMQILENIKGVGGIVITKEGIDWRVSAADETGNPTLTMQTPWELTIDGDTATCVNCMLMLSTVTVMAAGGQMQLTCDLTGHTDGWLCGVINGSTKEVSLDFRDPITAMSEEQEEIVFPLYRVVKNVDVWMVAVDVRAMPRIGAYW